MILIDALYINEGGGKILLDCLIKELEKTNETILYLIDSRNKNVYKEINSKNKIYYLDANIYKRHLFYKKYHVNFSKVFCALCYCKNINNVRLLL